SVTPGSRQEPGVAGRPRASKVECGPVVAACTLWRVGAGRFAAGRPGVLARTARVALARGTLGVALAAARLLRVVPVHADAAALVDDFHPAQVPPVELHALGAEHLAVGLPLGAADRIGQRAVVGALGRLRR